MKPYLKWVFSFLGLVPLAITAGIPIDKLKGEAVSELGSIVNGSFGGGPVKNQYLSRLGVNISALDTIEGKLRLTVGVGGIFYQPLPIGGFWQKSLKFAPKITEASSELIFTPNLSLEQGYFPLKYNSPAMNLGEYLLKSESYPTYVSTGGWTWVDSAFTRAFGMRLKSSHFNGKFKQEAGIYMELNNAPFYDITPAYIFKWRPANSIELGGGIALRRWFSPNTGNKSINPKDEARAASEYITISNFSAVQNQAVVSYTYDNGAGKRAEGKVFAVWNPGSTLDSVGLLAGKTGASISDVQMVQDGSVAGERTGIKRFLQNLAGCSSDSTKCSTYLSDAGNLSQVDASGTATGLPNAALISHSENISRKAINVMAHATINFSQMFSWNQRYGLCGLYTELAILGVQNQPVYYQNVLNRMPVMLGIHVPTFGVLDLLDFETEYLNNPYPDSYEQLAGQRFEKLAGVDEAIPDVDYSLRKFTMPAVHRDDWKWSVYAVKTLLPGVKLKLQAANDHLRMQYFDVDALAGAAFGAISAQPQTTNMSQWYFVAHLQWGF